MQTVDEHFLCIRLCKGLWYCMLVQIRSITEYHSNWWLAVLYGLLHTLCLEFWITYSLTVVEYFRTNMRPCVTHYIIPFHEIDTCSVIYRPCHTFFHLNWCYTLNLHDLPSGLLYLHTHSWGNRRKKTIGACKLSYCTGKLTDRQTDRWAQSIA